MILRMADWGRYPGAIVDDTTANQSFLRFASLLEQLGVKHNYLHLALHNPKLRGVNPRDPDLGAHWQLEMVKECTINPWYYFREMLRVPADGTIDGYPFRIDRGNFAMYWIFFNNIDAAVEFLRQHGKTIGICGLESWLIRFLRNSRTIHVTKGPVLREETITTLKRMRDGLPSWLWPVHPDDPDNKESFACLHRGNKLITAIGQNDPAAANGVGRGLTAGRLVNDEGPFTNNIHHILPAAFGSGTAARRINEAEGVPYGNVIATTPGDLATEEGKYMYNLMTSGIHWDERYIDVPTREELRSMIIRGSTSKNPRMIFYVKLNHRQLGTTDAELADMISNATGTPDQILRDYGGTWTTGGFNKPYTVDDAKRMTNSRMAPCWKEIRDYHIVDWFYTPAEMASKLSDMHVIGLDTSEAVGRDAIAMALTNGSTGELAAKLTVNETNVIGFAVWLAQFMLKYEKTVLIVERRSTGSSVIDAILLTLQEKVRDLHRRLYVRITQDHDRTSDLLQEFRRGPMGSAERFWSKFRVYAGFSTDGDKRKKLYGEVFSTAMRLCAHSIRAGELIDQILALVERKGRIDHAASGHDDLIIAWLLTMWLLIFGKNLDAYGLNNHRLMVRNHGLVNGRRGVDEEEEEKAMEEEAQQQKLVAEIETVTRDMYRTRCPVTQTQLRAKLHHLTSQLKIEMADVASMEGLREILQRQRMR